MTHISHCNPLTLITDSLSSDEEHLTPEQIDALIFERELLLLDAHPFGKSPDNRPLHRRPRRPHHHAVQPSHPARSGRAHLSRGRRVNSGPCSVYLLVHAHAPRFKIGQSNDPWVRGQNLPEAGFIQWGRSLQAVFPSRSRAAQVESMLHRALAAFRLNYKLHKGAAWDGSTEWFTQSGFRHAVNLLKVTPTQGEGSEPARLIPVDHRGLLVSKDKAPAADGLHRLKESKAAELRVTIPAALMRFYEAGQFNLERIDTIVEVMTMLGWKYRVRVEQAASGGLQIHCYGLV